MKVHALIRVAACAVLIHAGVSFAAAAASGTSDAAPPAAPNAQPPYSTATDQIRFGNAALFRNLIPSATLEQQSADEYAQILHEARRTKHLLGDDSPLVKRAREIANREIPFALKWNDRSKNWKWEVNVVRSDEIRMYCLPGGKIVIYSGLIDRLRLNDNELGMMIGHEIAHALREHARDRLGRQQAAQLSTGTIPPLFGFADISSTPLGIGEQLLAMRYTPADETEADVIGSEIASRAGYDPRAAITLWQKIDARTRRTPNGFIWMHPYGAARVHDLMKRLPDMMPLYAKAIGKTVDQLPNYAGMGRFKKPRL
ncbi:MAG: peptidase [Caballeronia sp.]|jgi:predicted Zn-dependent protease|uniref:M48 family metallopeptidase n=1 Tax=Caballeronia sp. TaxID=1931223 RepID=UPI002A3E08D6|nr:peptidase [Caballeronia sp.]